MSYTADVGCWDCGRTIDLPDETYTPQEAYTHAVKWIADNVYHCPKNHDDVVQIHEVDAEGFQRCVFDYMNGFELYERKAKLDAQRGR